jgi:hypothetical protein
MSENLDEYSGHPGKEALFEKLAGAGGVTPQVAENYFQILRLFFAGKLAKYQLEEKLKSLLTSQAIQVHNQVFVQVLQQAQQQGNTPSLFTHEKESKYVKRRVLVKRPIKSITSWNEESPTEKAVHRATLKRRRKNNAKNKADKVALYSNAPTNENTTTTTTSSITTAHNSNNRRQVDGNVILEDRNQATKHHLIASCENWNDAISEQSVYRVGKRMKQIAAENEIFQMETEATVGLFHAMELHLLDIIQATRQQQLEGGGKRSSNIYRPWTNRLTIRDLFRLTEYAQDILGDTCSIDRTSLAFTLF